MGRYRDPQERVVDAGNSKRLGLGVRRCCRCGVWVAVWEEPNSCDAAISKSQALYRHSVIAGLSPALCPPINQKNPVVLTQVTSVGKLSDGDIHISLAGKLYVKSNELTATLSKNAASCQTTELGERYDLDGM
jgi:hypothetical protein